MLSFGKYEDDKTSNNNNNWLESLEAQSDFPSVLVDWLKSNKDTAMDEEEENIFVEESFIVSQIRGEEEEEGVVERKNRTCFLLFGFRVGDERTRRFFLKNWKEVRRSHLLVSQVYFIELSTGERSWWDHLLPHLQRIFPQAGIFTTEVFIYLPALASLKFMLEYL